MECSSISTKKQKTSLETVFRLKQIGEFGLRSSDSPTLFVYGVTTLILFDTLAEDVEVVLAGAAKNKASTLR